jgi:hypothetical protein
MHGIILIAKLKVLLDKIFYSFFGIILIIFRTDFSFGKKLKQISKRKSGTLLRILGNGKSLNEVSNLFEQGEIDYMVVNRHVLSPEYEILKPGYYVLTDHHFFLHPEGLSIVDEIVRKTTWEMCLFMPYDKRTKNLYKEKVQNKNENIQIILYNAPSFFSRGYERLKKIAYGLNLAMPSVANVMVASICLGLFLRYKTIELYGVEHSWTKNLFINDNNEVCLYNPHFYDKEKVSFKTWKEIHHEETHLHEALRMYAGMFESYFELQNYAKRYGIQIINCTKDSFIDAFERNN